MGLDIYQPVWLNVRVTKYHAVRDELLDRLESMTAGEPLPAERDLALSLGVSRMTLRRAIDELVARGLLQRRPRNGVFVVGPKLGSGLSATSFTEDMHARGLRPGSTVLDFERRAAGARIGRRLGVSPDATVVHVTRLRLADDEPMSIEVLYISDGMTPDLEPVDLQDSSFYDVLHDRYGVTIVRGVQTIEPTVTDEEESRELGVPLHSPALLFERTSWDADGTVVEFVRSVYRGDRYQIRTELSVPQNDSSDRPAGR